MDGQYIFDALFSVLLLVGGWMLNNLTSSIRSLREKDESLSQDVTQIRIDVASEKASREGIERVLGSMDKKLDAIFEKLEKKADK